jgi:hypothetical protein
MMMMMMMMNRVRTFVEIKIYFFASIQIGCGSHSPYHPIGIGVYGPYGKVPRAWS